jgi:hypothetical protein
MRYLRLLLALAAALLGLSVLAGTAATAGAAPAPATGSLEICKIAAAPLAGTTFPFQVATWSGSFYKEISLTAGPAPGGCSKEYSFPVGTIVLVEEAASPGVPFPGVVPSFSLAPGPTPTPVPGLDLVAFSIKAGTNVLTVTDTPVIPTQTGTIELCKTAADTNVQGSFVFNLTGPGGYSSTTSVPTGQCNDVPNVPSGVPISITEPPIFPYALTSVTTYPTTALVKHSVDLDTSSAQVEVEPGSNDTVFFTNATLTGYVKICKTLDRPADDVLAGQTFNYSVSATFDGASIAVPSSVSVVAQAFPTQTCTFVGGTSSPFALPLGSLVTVSETGLPADQTTQVVGTSVSPANLNAGSPNSTTQQLYVGNLPAPNNVGSFGAGSVTQANFTNEAFGYVEVCKTSSSVASGTPFLFSVAGTPIGSVDVGLCSLGILKPVGTTTITETLKPHVTLTNVSGTGTGISQVGTNGATADVVYGTENIVYFDNEINQGTLKICKAQTSSDADLQNTEFNFSYSYLVNGVAYTPPAGTTPATGTAALKPGQCSLPINGIPVLNSALQPVTISVTEQTSSVPNVALYGVTAIGGDTIASQPTTYPHLLTSPATVTLNSLEGITNLTFTNGIDIPAG